MHKTLYNISTGGGVSAPLAHTRGHSCRRTSNKSFSIFVEHHKSQANRMLFTMYFMDSELTPVMGRVFYTFLVTSGHHQVLTSWQYFEQD